MGLNQEEGPGFVSVYLDDVIVYPVTVGEHFKHLERVTEHFMKSGLKICKCYFVCDEVQYLSHVITPRGIQPNKDRVATVQDYPRVPTSVKEVRQFIGLVSYYRRFIKGFARVAEPLHSLTRKDAIFE